jgi:hypothetical protein
VFWKSLKERDHLEYGRKWEDNIQIDLKQTGWEDVDWIHLAQDSDQRLAHVNT